MVGVENEAHADATSEIEGYFHAPSWRLSYLLHWSERFKYIYIETPKVACTTIKRVLQLAEVDQDEAKIPKDVHDRINSSIPRLNDNPERLWTGIREEEFFKFAFVRNPFTRILSCYLDKMVSNTWERNRLAPSLGLGVEEAPTFLEFLQAIERQSTSQMDIHWLPQSAILKPSFVKWDFIGRFEFFVPQFTSLCRSIRIPSGELKSTEHATHANEKILQYYGFEEATLVRSIYAADFHNFGYGWSPIVP